jgi:small GTP-binding protein
MLSPDSGGHPKTQGRDMNRHPEPTSPAVSERASFRIRRGSPRRMAWAGCGLELVIPVAQTPASELQIWSIEKDKLIYMTDCVDKPISVDVCPRSGLVAYSTNMGTVKLHDRNNRLSQLSSRNLRVHQDYINTIAWSSDGDMLATASSDRTICVLNRASTFATARKIDATADVHNSICWSPIGHQLAACGSEYAALLLDAESGRRLWTADRARDLNFHCIAWSATAEQSIAVGLSDGRIWLLDPQTGTRKAELEGHTQAVISIGFSFDGMLLFSLGMDNSIRIWRHDTFEPVGVIPTSSQITDQYLSLCCHRTKPLVAGPSAESGHISVWEFDSIALARAKPTTKTVHRTYAKVALVGESNVGKSCLAMRLAGQDYNETGTTHGVRFWPLSPRILDSTLAGSEWDNRELVLWDMGGQREYQLIHQIFLRDTTLALVLFDPTRRDVAYQEVQAWAKRLEKHIRGSSGRRILVGTKLDHDLGLVDINRVNSLCEILHFSHYVPTSAKFGTGIDVLAKSIAKNVDWNRIGRTTRPELFQVLRDEIDSLRGEVTIFISALVNLAKQRLRETNNNTMAVDIESVNAVVKQLSLQGIVVDTRLASQERALVLQIGEIERYAGSLLVEVSNNYGGIAAIEDQDILVMTRFPGIDEAERLPRSQERLVLEAVVQLMLQNGICLRHEGMLIFPSLFAPSPSAVRTTDLKGAICAYYDFSGAVENIYAALVTSITYSKRFGRLRLWSDGADFLGSSLFQVGRASSTPPAMR